jgi:hypothetical protein
MPRSALCRPELVRPFAVFACALATFAAAPATPPGPPAVGAKDRAAIVADIAAAVRDSYVDPATARRMAELLRRQLAIGAYDGLATLDAFTEKLTADLRSVSHDKHLAVGWDPTPPPPQAEELPDAALEARMAAMMRRENYCFRKVERLAGNVGYLKLDCFAPAKLGGGTAVAAMGFLAGTDALIVDLRDNHGGDASMVQFLASYLVPPDTHLDSFYFREGDRTEQSWSQAWVPGTRLAAVPVFVLTSSRTFSGAEELAYVLKALKRATLVGETTAGAANLTGIYRLQGYPVAVNLPGGRPINPVTGSNWEGTGVEPEVAAAELEALTVAHLRAVAALTEKAADPARKAELDFLRGVLEDRRKPASVSAAELQALAGTYGPRTVTVAGGALWYERRPERELRLVPVGRGRFVASDREDLRFRFERKANGEAVCLHVLYPDGREAASCRGGK